MSENYIIEIINEISLILCLSSFSPNWRGMRWKFIIYSSNKTKVFILLYSISLHLILIHIFYFVSLLSALKPNLKGLL